MLVSPLQTSQQRHSRLHIRIGIRSLSMAHLNAFIFYASSGFQWLACTQYTKDSTRPEIYLKYGATSGSIIHIFHQPWTLLNGHVAYPSRYQFQTTQKRNISKENKTHTHKKKNNKISSSFPAFCIQIKTKKIFSRWK